MHIRMDLDFFRSNLLMHYQPIIDVQYKRIVGFESLVRFQPSSRWCGKLSTLKFIEKVIQQDLTYSFDLFIIDSVCRDISRFRADGLIFSINLNPSTLSNSQFFTDVKNTLTHHELPPNIIAFEITEKSLISKYAERTTLPKLRKFGIKFYIDDFITGYANFGALINGNVDTIKIDKSITDEMLKNVIVEKFAIGITSLIHQLNKKVLFEGVETEEQYIFLKNIDCDFIQGYFISQAIDIESAISFVHMQ